MTRPRNTDKDLAAFGKRVATLRQAKGLTQEQLAEKAGLSEDSIGAIERGKRWARLTTLHKLAKGLGITTDELFRGLKG